MELDGKHYRRETNTMPQWAGSCWYYLRFLDPKNDKALVDPELEKAWMPVDLYVGGAEHAVLHLLYARFWHKVLFDRGYVRQNEPFHKLVNQGMILGEPKYFQKQAGEAELAEVPIEQVELRDNGAYLAGTDLKLQAVAEKMSKSRGNVINPDRVVEEFGADSLRLFEMFMGPLEAVKPWSTKGVIGVRSFLDRVWRMIVDDRAENNELLPSVQDIAPTPEQDRVLHKTIAAVTRDIEQMSFNTAIPRMMEFTNFFFKETVRPKSAMSRFVQLLAPFAPHIAEELWEILGGEKTLAYEPWPKYDEALLREDSVEIPVQFNGKLRGKIVVPTGLGAAATEEAARADEKIAELLVGKTVVKLIVVPGRMVNFVVK